MTPAFAVVGQPNKGKSSIVATLAEDERVAISEDPGTTRQAMRYTLEIDGRPIYTLIDTPGFQRARAVLAWLQANSASAHERSSVVQGFLEAHRDDPEFRDECELLRPIVEGAGILYVVDGTKPYGSEYEVEMEVLRWTGRPRMALINLIGSGDHVEEWREALGQYFSIVRLFDAVHADFDKRTDLLRAFAELDETWKPALLEAVAGLEAERARRIEESAVQIAVGLVDALTAMETAKLDPARRDEQVQELETRLRDALRGCEERMRREVQAIYRHPDLETSVEGVAGLDLFEDASWQLFGLSRRELLVAAAISGAVAGSAIDLLVGGASLLLGAGIGAAISGAGVLLGANELAKVRVLGTELGGNMLQVGPVKSPNFPWVLLGRAWLHHRLVAERNHALRDAITMSAAAAEHLVDEIPGTLRAELARQLKFADRVDVDMGRLSAAIARVLNLELGGGAAASQRPNE